MAYRVCAEDRACINRRRRCRAMRWRSRIRSELASFKTASTQWSCLWLSTKKDQITRSFPRFRIVFGCVEFNFFSFLSYFIKLRGRMTNVRIRECSHRIIGIVWVPYICDLSELIDWSVCSPCSYDVWILRKFVRSIYSCSGIQSGLLWILSGIALFFFWGEVSTVMYEG